MIVTLVYHMVNRDIDAAIAVSEESFAAHLALLRAEGYAVLGLDEVLRVVEGEMPVPERAVFLTFDDGYADNVDAALPRLREQGFTATVFVPTAHVGGTNDWDRRAPRRAKHADWDDLERWIRAGGAIGGHTHEHLDARATPVETFASSIDRNRALLRERLGIDVAAFAYPYGHATPAARGAVADRHRAAWVVEGGTWDPRADRYLLNRLAVDRRTSARDLGRALDDYFDGGHRATRRARPKKGTLPFPAEKGSVPFFVSAPRRGSYGFRGQSGRRVVIVAGGIEDRVEPAPAHLFARLLEEGCDAHLVHRDDVFDEPGLAGLPDDVLGARVHPPPRALRRRRPRADLVLGALAAFAARPLPVLGAVLRRCGARRLYQRLALIALRPDLVRIPSPAEALSWADLEPATGAPFVVGKTGDDMGAGSDADSADPCLRILAFGPLDWRRGLEHLLHGLRLAIERGLRARCRIVGSAGDHADAIAFARHELGLEDVVELVAGDPSAECGDHLAWADVVVDAAVVGGTENGLEPATRMGCTTIRTTEASADVTARSILVPRRDAESIAEALLRVVARPSSIVTPRSEAAWELAPHPSRPETEPEPAAPR